MGSTSSCTPEPRPAQSQSHPALSSQAFPQLPVLALVGDPKQLPAIVISEQAVCCGYDRSLFERLQACRVPVHMLNTQYRMHPAISSFPATQFYQGELRDGPNVLHPTRGSLVTSTPLFAKMGRYAVLDVQWGREEKPEGSTSSRNPAESRAVVELVKALSQDIMAAHRAAGGEDEAQASRWPLATVGITSAYSDQVENILQCLLRTGRSATSSVASGSVGHSVVWGPLLLEARTIDGFQVRRFAWTC